MCIEELGAMGWQLNHDLSDGRIDDNTGGVAKTVMDGSQTSMKLVSELIKFGVVAPDDYPPEARYSLNDKEGLLDLGVEMPSPPNGLIWYKDWYKMMKVLWNEYENRNMICSACPFCNGDNSRGINCSIFPGSLNRLSYPYQCVMIGDGNEDSYKMLEDDFFEKMAEEGRQGTYGVEKFKKHRQRLIDADGDIRVKKESMEKKEEKPDLQRWNGGDED